MVLRFEYLKNSVVLLGYISMYLKPKARKAKGYCSFVRLYGISDSLGRLGACRVASCGWARETESTHLLYFS